MSIGDPSKSHQGGSGALKKQTVSEGRDGGHTVSVLAFYSEDPSSITAEVCSFYSVKEATDGHLKVMESMLF